MTNSADSKRRFYDAGAWRAVLLMTLGLTLSRLVVLFSTPLELYPDEAQYWLWSRTLDWGYFSKPPMIAWAIWATTALGGDAEAWVRLSAPLFHAGATLAVFAAGRRLQGPAVGFAAAALYALIPGVQLSSAVISTDAPLMFFLALTLLAYFELQQAPPARGMALAAGLGVTLGLAFLSKYAAAYALIGIALHLATTPAARGVWRPGSIMVAIAAFALVLTPNLAWNAAHHFATLQHTAANAAWGGRRLFNPGELGEFVLSQFGVFGPIPFFAATLGVVALAFRRRLTPAERLLTCFFAPPVVIVAVQAFISRANANWATAGYAAGAILAAAVLMRPRRRGWLVAAILIQAAVAALFMVWSVSPATAEAMGMANSFKRAKGWAEMTDQIIVRARAEPGLSAVAVNDRFLFNVAAYYGRDYFGTPAAPPLVVWLRADHPENQAETTNPLTPAVGRRVLNVSLEQVYRDEMARDFQQVSGQEILSVRLDRKRRRRAELFIGTGFAPRPRDPVTGLPTPP